MKPIVIILILIIGAAGAWYYWTEMRSAEVVEERGDVAVLPETATPPPVVEESPPEMDEELTEPATLTDQEPAIAQEPLPPLDNSDPAVRETAADLVGQSTAMQYLVTESIIPKMVAALDALSSRQVPSAIMPLQPPGGEILVTEDPDPPTPITNPLGDEMPQYLLDSANYSRYTPYVEMVESTETADLIEQYQRYEPLMQQSFSQLGYTGVEFHDRLLMVIDELLAAPDPEGPVRLIKPEAYYLFADPELEALSAGQKIMVRMGSDNAARVKEKLRELRAELIATGES